MILRTRRNSYYIPPIIADPPVMGCTIDYALNYDPEAEENDGSCEFENKFNSVMVVETSIENVNTHGIYVQDEFEMANPETECLMTSFAMGYAIDYAMNTGLAAIIFSYTGLPSEINHTSSLYPNTQVFMPLGNNSPVLLTNPSSIPHIVTCGAGIAYNENGYGPGLEFWDSEVSGNPANHSSLSNSKIAGKIMKIKQTLNCSWWEARYRARITADRTLLTHPDGKYWNQNNGFGKINVQNAIDFVGAIAPDPYLNNTNPYVPYIP